MSIVNSVQDTCTQLELIFHNQKHRTKFRPVYRLVKDDSTNLCEMFCITPAGQLVKKIPVLEFRPTITSSAKVRSSFNGIFRIPLAQWRDGRWIRTRQYIGS